ncbi:MAG TPA: hypothetical protein VFR34_00250 [Paracoccaceae bacterium]|nr:hypothetical protein [Paracoccaceae bacterium]
MAMSSWCRAACLALGVAMMGNGGDAEEPVGPSVAPVEVWSDRVEPGGAGVWLGASAMNAQAQLEARCRPGEGGLRFRLTGASLAGAGEAAAMVFAIFREGRAARYEARFRREPGGAWAQEEPFGAAFLDAFAGGNWLDLEGPGGQVLRFPLLGASPARAEVRRVCGL